MTPLLLPKAGPPGPVPVAVDQFGRVQLVAHWSPDDRRLLERLVVALEAIAATAAPQPTEGSRAEV